MTFVTVVAVMTAVAVVAVAVIEWWQRHRFDSGGTVVAVLMTVVTAVYSNSGERKCVNSGGGNGDCDLV